MKDTILIKDTVRGGVSGVYVGLPLWAQESFALKKGGKVSGAFGPVCNAVVLDDHGQTLSHSSTKGSKPGRKSYPRIYAFFPGQSLNGPEVHIHIWSGARGIGNGFIHMRKDNAG